MKFRQRMFDLVAGSSSARTGAGLRVSSLLVHLAAEFTRSHGYADPAAKLV